MEPITFDLPGWDEQAVPQNRVWHNRFGDGLGLYHYPIPPDIPVPLTDLNGLRRFYRQQAAGAGGGLIELSLVEVDSVPFIRFIVKLPQVPHGVAYLVSLTVPRRDFSYVLKFQGVEKGVTGMRDAVILDRLLGDGTVRVGPDESLVGWNGDPYDAAVTGPGLMNRSEAEQYDSDFPDHPLSRLRAGIRQLEASLRISDAIKAAAPFDGPPPHSVKRPWWKRG